MAALVSMALLFSSCSKDENPSAEELFLNKLAQTWQVDAITLDHEDVTDLFPEMAITFTKNKTFSTQHPVGNIWFASGVFTLQDGTGTLFNLDRNDGVLVTVTALDESTLTFTMGFVKAPGGRINGLVGQYVFNMKR